LRQVPAAQRGALMSSGTAKLDDPKENKR